MYPNLYYMFKDLFGVEWELLKIIQSFGFFVAIAFLAGSYFFAKELKRKEEEGLLQSTTKKILKGAKATPLELILPGILGFVIGFKLLEIILNYQLFMENPQEFILSMKGSVIGGIIGGAITAYLKYYEKEKERLNPPVWESETIRPHEHVGNMTIIAALTGLLGAKIFHNLENFSEFLEDPIEALLSFSGLTMYGGLICGAAAVLYYAKKNNLTATHVIDACVPALMLAYGIGRIGCHVAGDGDWGIVNLAAQPEWLSFLPEWTWAYHYPHNVLNDGIPIPGCEGKYCHMLPETVFPTALYEVAMSIALFGVLWGIRKKIKAPGTLFSIYLIFNGLERFFIEKIRVNTVYDILGFHPTQAEIISVILIILGITGIWYFGKKYKEKAG